jgi:hypothetical protein
MDFSPWRIFEKLLTEVPKDMPAGCSKGVPLLIFTLAHILRVVDSKGELDLPSCAVDIIEYNVSLIIKVRETRVKGEEGMPKTPKSTRDIKMLDPVMTAIQEQAKKTWGKSDYVFLNLILVPKPGSECEMQTFNKVS